MAGGIWSRVVGSCQAGLRAGKGRATSADDAAGVRFRSDFTPVDVEVCIRLGRRETRNMSYQATLWVNQRILRNSAVPHGSEKTRLRERSMDHRDSPNCPRCILGSSIHRGDLEQVRNSPISGISPHIGHGCRSPRRGLSSLPNGLRARKRRIGYTMLWCYGAYMHSVLFAYDDRVDFGIREQRSLKTTRNSKHAEPGDVPKSPSTLKRSSQLKRSIRQRENSSS